VAEIEESGPAFFFFKLVLELALNPTNAGRERRPADDAIDDHIGGGVVWVAAAGSGAGQLHCPGAGVVFKTLFQQVIFLITPGSAKQQTRAGGDVPAQHATHLVHDFVFRAGAQLVLVDESGVRSVRHVLCAGPLALLALHPVLPLAVAVVKHYASILLGDRDVEAQPRLPGDFVVALRKPFCMGFQVKPIAVELLVGAQWDVHCATDAAFEKVGLLDGEDVRAAPAEVALVEIGAPCHC